jgi:hypothetical protein|tara:strand:- start:33943 stop:34179 length:237 start_codon:yes stop_codon:yes gene_type:complete
MGGSTKTNKRRLSKNGEAFAKEQANHVEGVLNMLYTSCETQCITIGSKSIPLEYVRLAVEVINKGYAKGFAEAMKNND